MFGFVLLDTAVVFEEELAGFLQDTPALADGTEAHTHTRSVLHTHTLVRSSDAGSG